MRAWCVHVWNLECALCESSLCVCVCLGGGVNGYSNTMCTQFTEQHVAMQVHSAFQQSVAAFTRGFQLASGCILFNPDSNPPREVG